jgi:hypothetical protein
MRRSDRLVEFPSRQSVEHFRKAHLVRITRWGLAIRLDPFGMLNPQVVVNLLPKLAVGVDLGRRGNSIGERFKCDARRLVERTASVSALCSETNEFHKRLSILG